MRGTNPVARALIAFLQVMDALFLLVVYFFGYHVEGFFQVFVVGHGEAALEKSVGKEHLGYGLWIVEFVRGGDFVYNLVEGYLHGPVELFLGDGVYGYVIAHLTGVSLRKGTK